MNAHRRGRAAAKGLIGALLLAMLAASCGGGADIEVAETTTTTSTTTTTTTTTVPLGPLSPMTGLRLDADSLIIDRPTVMVKISNNDGNSLAALTGIDQADIVIEERIEDRATRFAVLFHTNLPDRVGAVRSARPADLELMANLNTPLLVFSGAFPTVLRDINSFAANGGAVLVVDDGRGVNLVRDDDLPRPDNLFADLSSLVQKFGAEAKPAVAIFDFLDDDEAQASSAIPGEAVTVTGRDIVSFVYDPARGYVRVQDGLVHVTADEVPVALVADNLIVMETIYTPSSYDPRNVDADTLSGGAVSVMIEGQRFEGTWSRESLEAPYRFVDAEGADIRLAPGRTWLTLVPGGRYEFAVDEEIAALVLGGEG